MLVGLPFPETGHIAGTVWTRVGAGRGFGHATLEVPVRHPSGNIVGSGASESGGQGRG